MPGTAPQPTSPPELDKARVSPGLFAPKRLLQSWLTLGLDLLFPPRCAGCGRIDVTWCDQCRHDLSQIVFPSQVRPLTPLAGIASTAVHQGMIREAVQALKYDNARRLAEPLGERLTQLFRAQAWTVDIVVPVPLHARRLAERGYNQAQLLGEYVAKDVALPCIPMALRRQRNTQSQVTLGAAERLANMEDAFTADSRWLTSQNVLLIDDVYTTGATLRACAQAALLAGANAVYALTVTVARV